jgi:hypothetical protein
MSNGLGRRHQTMDKLWICWIGHPIDLVILKSATGFYTALFGVAAAHPSLRGSEFRGRQLAVASEFSRRGSRTTLR